MPKGVVRYRYGDDVVSHILQLEAQGQPLRGGHVDVCHAGLYGAAQRHFGSWRKALAAAGIDADTIYGRKRWTPDGVIEAIRQLDRQGVPLHYASAYRKGGGVNAAATKHFGSWDEALAAAGYDPQRVRRSRQRWTREGILDLIRSRVARGLPIKSYSVRPHSAKGAAKRIFGSWRAALEAAGVPNPYAGRRSWTKASVVEAILARQRSGQPLSYEEVARQAVPLISAGRAYFRGWNEALAAAGIDPETVRRQRRPYTPEEILDGLRQRDAAGQPLNRPGRHPDGLVRAAKRLFGSWADALRAAGVPANEGRRTQWTQVSVVEAILIRQYNGQSLVWSDVLCDASRLGNAVRNYFGSWGRALRAAGIDPATVRPHPRRPPYTREEILERVQQRDGEGQPRNRPTQHPDGLAQAARRLFGSWANVLRAAGLGTGRPSRGRRGPSRRREEGG